MHGVQGLPWGVGLAYIVSGLLFILALRGLSSPMPSRAGNRLGMAGMALAVVTTLVTHSAVSMPEIGAAIFIGALIGVFVVRHIAMAAMPPLVAAFHSLVGLAAVAVGAAVSIDPGPFGVLEPGGADILPASRIAMGLGVAIGAITVAGSVVAFLKLAGIMSGKPIRLPARHFLTLGLLVATLALVGLFRLDTPVLFWAIVGLGLLIGLLLVIPIGRADMPVVLSMLNSSSGWAAAAMGLLFQNIAMIVTGALVGTSGAILGTILCRAKQKAPGN